MHPFKYPADSRSDHNVTYNGIRIFGKVFELDEAGTLLRLYHCPGSAYYGIYITVSVCYQKDLG